ncbi:MAG: hypothetical protein LBU70_00030 [Chitinispirillales bacterium]|jgi:hypothetical protein|nr:hypothetical protein [Chitinispirillales bacterium]
MIKKVVILLTTAAAVCALSISVTGCSDRVSVESGQARIDKLAAMGVPDSELRELRIHLARMKGGGATFKTTQASLTAALKELEERVAKLLEESGPFMDSLRKACNGKLTLLSGIHLDTAKAGQWSVDSLMQLEDQQLRARYRLETWSAWLDTLVVKQQVADSLRSRFIGIWIKELESPDPQEMIVERTEIHMRPDSTLFIMESKRANTPYMREDWRFETMGTWDLLGDVALHYVTRERRVRQTFAAIDESTGRWRTETQDPFDSTVAKGTKDRFATWAALNAQYKHFPSPARGRR